MRKRKRKRKPNLLSRNNYVFQILGYGAVLTNTGEVELDALIINGTDLSAGKAFSFLPPILIFQT
jgi:hypothetical protein